MNNYTALSFYYGFYSKPQGGYPPPNPDAININNAPVVIRPKGSKTYRPVHSLNPATKGVQQCRY